MASTKELRTRIKSIKNTSKVTKAMEMVSAAKMRRAQEQALGGRIYSELINQVLTAMASKIDLNSHPLLLGRNRGEAAVLIISTDRGLCGSLNSNLFREALGLKDKTTYVTLGKKGKNFVIKSEKPLEADFALLEKPTLVEARTLAHFLTKGFLDGTFNKVSVLSTHFVSTLKQEPILRQLLPIVDAEVIKKISEQEKGWSEFLFEPNADRVLETMLPHYVEMEIYQILLESAASEHSARMVAMKNASDNSNDLVDDLTLVYNGLRQAAITNEILDITTAVVALE